MSILPNGFDIPLAMHDEEKGNIACYFHVFEQKCATGSSLENKRVKKKRQNMAP